MATLKSDLRIEMNEDSFIYLLFKTLEKDITKEHDYILHLPEVEIRNGKISIQIDAYLEIMELLKELKNGKFIENGEIYEWF